MSVKENMQNVDLKVEKGKVKAVIDQFEQAWETGDINLLSKIIAHDADMVNYGTDAAEYFVGWQALKDAVEEMLEALKDIKISVKDQVIKVHPAGNVAWFSQVWDWDLVAQGTPFHSEGQRFTGVLEKRGGNWVFVQFHNSVPVAG